MKVAVTGANGMIGRALVPRLIQAGHEVVALLRNGKASEALPSGARVRITDYTFEALTAAFRGVEAVIHLAAMRWNPEAENRGFETYWGPNVRLTEQILRACIQAKVARVSVASSIAVYSSANPIPFRETDPPMPQNLYGLSKLTCEHLAAFYARRDGIKANALRIAQVIGYDATQSQGVLMRFVRAAWKKQPLRLLGKGAAGREYIAVEDVAEAFVRSIAHEAPQGVFNIGMGRSIPYRELAETINGVFENPAGVVMDETVEENPVSGWMDGTRARTVLEWRPTHDLHEALTDLRREIETLSPFD